MSSVRASGIGDTVEDACVIGQPHITKVINPGAGQEPSAARLPVLQQYCLERCIAPHLLECVRRIGKPRQPRKDMICEVPPNGRKLMYGLNPDASKVTSITDAGVEKNIGSANRSSGKNDLSGGLDRLGSTWITLLVYVGVDGLNKDSPVPPASSTPSN